MKKTLQFALVLLVGLALAVMVIAGLRARPAVAAVPTPVGAQAGGQDFVFVTYIYTNTSADIDLHSVCYQTAAYVAGDVHIDLDVNAANQVTCTLQWSNDCTNMLWADGLELFDETSDTTWVTQTQWYGRYSRVTCTLNSANPITLEIKAKLFN